VFVFEAHQAEWLVDALIDNPFQWMVEKAFDAWRPLLSKVSREWHERSFWERSPDA
jgi:hypothetical protein